MWFVAWSRCDVLLFNDHWRHQAFIATNTCINPSPIEIIGSTLTVYPKKYAHGYCFAELCCGYTLTDFPISIRLTSLALWQSNDCPVPAKQPWWIWINTSCEFIMNDCITTTKQSTTKPCAYFLGYTVHAFPLAYSRPTMRKNWNKQVILSHLID